jgi:hypothetical protein
MVGVERVVVLTMQGVQVVLMEKEGGKVLA